MRSFARACAALAAPIVAAAFVVPAAAAGRPDPAGAEPQARAREFDPSLLRTGDLIRYRDLRRDDFRAKQPPAESAGYHGELGAATCVFLTTDPDTYIYASSRGLDLERGVSRAVVENLAFLAYMDRDCSWWNPSPLGLPASYILQHEQIHFALFEITARRLNDRADALMRRLETVSTSHERAIEEIHQQLDAELQRAIEEILERSDEFDRETSRTYRQDRQNWWWRSVNEDLDRLRRPDPDRFEPRAAALRVSSAGRERDV